MQVEDVSEQPSSTLSMTIDEQIDHLGKCLENHALAAKDRLSAVAERLAEIQREYDAAKADIEKAEHQLSRYRIAFSDAPIAEPYPAVETAHDDEDEEEEEEAAPDTAPPPSTKRNHTKPERMAALMGDGVWDVGGLEKILASQGGDDFKSSNPRSYIYTTLSSHEMRVQGPDGKDIRQPDGDYFKVRMFVKVERGKYRVRTAEEIQAEVRKKFGASEVIMSESHTPADEIFAEQGINIRPALVSSRHHG